MLGSIQALRGLAALAVVAYHAQQWREGGFEVGRAGVDVFFVISGLIMWRVAAGHAATPGAFLWRRVTRVAPLYWLATLGVAATAVVWPMFLPEVRLGWVHLLLSLAFIPHLDPAGLPFPTLAPGWTLDYEAVFYLVFALALAAPRAWRARVAIGGLAALSALGFQVPPLYFLGANPMLLQFAAGIVLGWIDERGGLPGPRAGAAMLAAALAIWVALPAFGWFSELWRPLQWGVPALLTVGGALALERSGAVRAPAGLKRAALALGDASYAIYILHLPATAIVAHLMGPHRSWLLLPEALAFSALVGLAAHRFVERPLLKALRAISPSAAWTRGSIRYSPRS